MGRVKNLLETKLGITTQIKAYFDSSSLSDLFWRLILKFQNQKVVSKVYKMRILVGYE